MQTQPLGGLEHFLMLQWVVHAVTTRPYIFKLNDIHIFFQEFAIQTLFTFCTVL
jgi:hypothetical protein